MPDTRKEKLMAALDALDDEKHEKAEAKDEDKKPKGKAKKSKLYEMMK